jgi:hypothetical protein
MKTIIVNQPGKVGSMTVVEYLASHYNLPDNTRVTRNGREVTRYDNVRYWSDNLLSLFHTHHMDWLPGVVGDYYICLTREPISRNLSNYFEWFAHHDEKFVNQGSESIIKNFIKDYNHTAGIDWFDSEFPKMGFNLYEKPFNINKGYEIYEKDGKKLLFIRTEDIDRSLRVGLSDLLGEEFTSEIVRHFNTSTTIESNRPYDLVYKKVKSELIIPNEILDELFESNHIKHFYNEQEIEKFYKKWQKTA